MFVCLLHNSVGHNKNILYAIEGGGSVCEIPHGTIEVSVSLNHLDILKVIRPPLGLELTISTPSDAVCYT